MKITKSKMNDFFVLIFLGTVIFAARRERFNAYFGYGPAGPYWNRVMRAIETDFDVRCYDGNIVRFSHNGEIKKLHAGDVGLPQTSNIRPENLSRQLMARGPASDLMSRDAIRMVFDELQGSDRHGNLSMRAAVREILGPEFNHISDPIERIEQSCHKFTSLFLGTNPHRQALMAKIDKEAYQPDPNDKDRRTMKQYIKWWVDIEDKEGQEIGENLVYESLGIFYYTTNAFYREMNQAIVLDSKRDPDASNIADLEFFFTKYTQLMVLLGRSMMRIYAATWAVDPLRDLGARARTNVFRGIARGVDTTLFDHYKENLEIIRFPHFISTSTIRSVPEEFAMTDGAYLPGSACFRFDLRPGDTVAIWIPVLSAYPKEEEVLLFPHSAFRIYGSGFQRQQGAPSRPLPRRGEDPRLVKDPYSTEWPFKACFVSTTE